MRYKLLPLICLTAFLWPLSPAKALDGYEKDGDRWIQVVRKGERRYKSWTNKMSYMISLPTDYDPKSDKKYPTVVHLHGYGGKNAPTEASAKSGGAFQNYYRKLAEPIIVIFPQWDGGWWSRPEASKKVINLLSYEIRKLAIDKDRVYLTGQSMGGYGSFDIAGQYPKVFAAVAPFSSEWGPFGKGKGIAVPKNLAPYRPIPYWSAHGMKDNVVPYNQNKLTVEAMRRGGVYIRFSAYPKGGHHVKQFLYTNQNFFDWLLAQKRGTPINYELALDDGSGTPKVLGYFEPGTTQEIKAAQENGGKKFSGWTVTSGSTFEHTTTTKLMSKPKFKSTKAATTIFTMPKGDVIIKANYK